MEKLTGRRPNTYALYHGEEYIAEGTIKELAEHEGVKEDTIRFYQSPSYAKRKSRKRVVVADPFIVVNLEKLEMITAEKGYMYKELSDILNISDKEYYRKKSGRNKFKLSEIEELEDLFFLKEGELLL